MHLDISTLKRVATRPTNAHIAPEVYSFRRSEARVNSGYEFGLKKYAIMNKLESIGAAL